MSNQTFWDWFEAEARPKLGGRGETFAKIFEYLDTIPGPVRIVETGCVRRAGNWEGDGQSTILFDHYVSARGGSVHSIDIDPAATDLCRSLISNKVKVHTGDSVTVLNRMAKPREKIDLLYLDSFDLTPTDPIPSALHHLNELMAALPMLLPDTLVVVDDSPNEIDDNRLEVGGKGMLVAKYALHAGAELQFCGYQIGWTRMVGALRGDAGLRDLVAQARTHVEADHPLNAESLYRLILGRTTPPMTGIDRVAHGEACAFYARLALARNKLGAAADWYREALQADPLATDYRLELCIKVFLPMGALKQAKVEAERATRIAPDYPATWRTLGGIEHELGDAKACRAAYDQQIKIAPNDCDALLDRATIALDLADYDCVREMCAKVIRTERAADAWHCLAMVAYREGRHEDAIVLYDRAISMKCRDEPIAHWNKSLALHSIGRYREGWQEHEYREFQKSNIALALPMTRFTLPRWKGEPPPAVIHVHHEAGMGDNLCMARYLPLLAQQGYQVRYEAHDQMVDLMRTSFPGIEIVPRAVDYPGALGIKPFDYHSPICSLPAVLGTDIDTVPWNGAYLKADPKLMQKYRTMLSRDRRLIGLCWSSGIREGIWISEYGRRKSMSFEALRPIFNLEDLFVSLQVGPERAEQSDPVIDILPVSPSWSETAALVECLDLVITVDTAVAHLAGAMGKPVWLMMHTEGSWHFMCARPGASWNERSPWYPSARLYRQTKQHEWGEVIERIRCDLCCDKASLVA